MYHNYTYICTFHKLNSLLYVNVMSCLFLFTVSNNDALFLLATCYFRAGKVARAYSLLRQHGCPTAQCRFLMARCCMQTNKWVTLSPEYDFYVIHVKLEKFKRGRSPSLHLAKERDFHPKPFSSINFEHQHSNSNRNIENDEIFPPYNGLKLFIWITLYDALHFIIVLGGYFADLTMHFHCKIQIQFTLFRRKW